MSQTKLSEETKTLVKDRARDKKGRIRCAHCNREVAKGGYEIDHIIAEQNSLPEARSNPDNLQVLCSRKKDDAAGWGCHQKKSAREAAEWAKKNRGPRDLVLPLALGGLGVSGLGYAYTSAFVHPFMTPEHWLASCAGVFTLALSTYLVHNGFKSRRPLESIPSYGQLREAADGIDTIRATAAVREVVGPKGDVRVISASKTEATVHYPGTGLNDSKEAEGRADLIAKFSAKMGGRWQAIEWDTTHDRVQLRLREELPEREEHPGGLDDPARPWHVLPISSTFAFDLKKTSHILIIGVTNMGKTSIMRSITCALAASSARGHVKSILADPKKVELMGFEGWPGIDKVVTDAEELWRAPIELVAEMERRHDLARRKRVPLNSHERIVFELDEFEQYVLRMTDLWQNSDDKEFKKKTGQRFPPPLVACRTLLSMSRRAGIHCVIGTQSPDATFFGGTGARQNLQGRAAVGPIGPEQAKMAFGDSSIGRDVPNIKGRTTVQTLDGLAEEIQAWWTPDPSDIDGDNTPADWRILERVGMPKELIRL